MADYKDKAGNILSKKLYPVVAEALQKKTSSFMDHIAKFINKNHDKIYDVGLYDNIMYTMSDKDDMFKSLGLNENDILNIIKETYFFDVAGINPQCVKDPYVEVLLAAIRYYAINNEQKRAEITAIYLTFSGKFYASLFASAFPKAPPSKYRAVMDYVINNMLTDKYDLKKYGTVFGAIKSMCTTWIETYKKQILSLSSNDEDVKMLIQQLRDRLRSFIFNIAKLYYKAYEEKLYMNYETDSIDPDDYHISDNDANRAARITENALNYMTSNKVSLSRCNKCKDTYVKASEVCSVMEAILGDNKNLGDVKTVLNILVCDYFRHYPGGSVKSIEFVYYSQKAKPNTKDPYLIKLKEIITGFLDQYSVAYRRKSESRKISYYKAILTYFILVLNEVGN